MNAVNLTIPYWHAWGPNIGSQEDALAWATGERAWGDEGKADVSFLPAMFRRRLSPHSKMVMAATQPCLERCEAESIRTVFASRWGEAGVTIKLLEQMAQRELVSPMDFSLSVHNTASGLFSIHHKNHEPTTALSGDRDTFCYGLMEAAGILHRYPDKPLLFVVSDEPLPCIYEEFIDEKQYPYAIAMLLGHEGDGIRIKGTCRGRCDGSNEKMAEPQAMTFLRWLLSGEPTVELAQGRRRWQWERA